MRCNFCGRRIRNGDYSEVLVDKGKIFYHYAPEGSDSPHRHCSAAAVHKSKALGVRPTLFPASEQTAEAVLASRRLAGEGSS